MFGVAVGNLKGCCGIMPGDDQDIPLPRSHRFENEPARTCGVIQEPRRAARPARKTDPRPSFGKKL